MIIAAGLTPAWQQMLVFDELKIDAVNRAREAYWCSSGKVLNVGLALHHLGGPSRTVALVGGMPGKSIEAEFEGLGAPSRWVWAEQPTRVCTTVLDRARGQTTELVENAHPVTPTEVDSYLQAFAEEARSAELAVLSGSLPAGAPPSFYRDLMDRTAARIVLDARGPELLAALELRPLCVKPNREELSRTFGRPLETPTALREAMEETCRLGAGWVVVSQSTQALWALGDGRLHVFRPSRVATVNPIGCGDCLAAGIAWALRDGLSMPDAIRFGMAAAAENAAMMLPGRLDLAKVRERMEDVREER